MRSDHALIDRVVSGLRARGETVSFAESCTGGLLSSLMTATAGVSDVFVGSVVAYSNAVKSGVLGVAGSQLRAMGAVSLPVARSMADGRALSARINLGFEHHGHRRSGRRITAEAGRHCVHRNRWPRD